MSKLIKTFLIPKNLQVFISPYCNKNSSYSSHVVEWMTTEFSIYDDHCEETHVYHKKLFNIKKRECVTLKFEYSEFNNFNNFEVTTITKTRKHLFKADEEIQVDWLYYDYGSEFNGVRSRQSILAIVNVGKEDSLICAIKKELDIAISNYLEVNKEKLLSKEKEKEGERKKLEQEQEEISKQVHNGREKLRAMFGVTTLPELEALNKDPFEIFNLNVDNDVEKFGGISFVSDSMYLLLDKDTTSFSNLLTWIKLDAEKLYPSHYDHDEHYKIKQQINLDKRELYSLNSLFEKVDNRLFNINTLSNAKLTPIQHDYSHLKKGSSTLGIMLYEQAFGTAAAINRIVKDANQGPTIVTSGYHLTLFVCNPLFEGEFKYLILRHKKNIAEKYVQLINSATEVCENENKGDSLEQIMKLKQLLDCGAITEDEFKEKKAILMQRI